MKKKIVISNIYGKFNLGDYAIRNSALNLIGDISKNVEITLLCESTNSFNLDNPHKLSIKKQYSPYGYGMDNKDVKKSILVKLKNLFVISFLSGLYCIIGAVISSYLPTEGFYSYIKQIKNADLVVLMGGGYFITKNKYSDFFGVILNILPLYVAKFYGKKIIVLPISFGPFANPVHEMLIGNAIKNTSVYSRDKISLKLIKKYNKRAKFSPDLALYDWDKYEKVKKENYFILTVKDYLSIRKQIKVEEEISKYILDIYKKYNLKCIFIPTGANPIEENDLPTAERLAKLINNDTIFSIVIPKTPQDTKTIIRSAKFSVCTRMHSAIFSITEYTPFIAIAYEHKTVGLLEYLDLSNWYVKMEGLSHSSLEEMTNKLLHASTYSNFVEHLVKHREKVHSYRDSIIQDIRFQLK